MSDQNDASDDADDSPVSGPLVFSCRKCRTIVGDSFSMLSSNQEDETITLSAASHVQRGTLLCTSYESLDEGNSYFWFQCSNPQCQEKLGKYYVTTSRDLDHVREKFTFSVEAIDSYELGKAQFGHIPEADVIELPAADTAQEENVGASIDLVQEDVSKIHHVLVDLVQRVGDLERELNTLKRERAAEIANQQAGGDLKRPRN